MRRFSTRRISQKRFERVTSQKVAQEINDGGKFYHWYDEPDTVDIPIDLSYILDIVQNAMTKCGKTKLSKFLYEMDLATIYLRIIYNKNVVKVGILKRFCKTFGIEPKDLEGKGAILNPIFPLAMDSKAFIKVKSHASNEGRIAFAYMSVKRLSYHNQDPVLLRCFANAVIEVGGDIIGQPRLEKKALVIFANRILARALVASGLSYGRKTLSDPSLDPLVEQNRELCQFHIRATLNEEGWPTLTIKHRKANLEIAWGRSVDITDKLSREQIDELKEIVEKLGKRKMPIGSIEGPELMRIITLNSPRLLHQEENLLIHNHKQEQWPSRFPTRVHLSKRGRITAFWEIHFNRSEIIDLIHDEYGMLPGTWKAKRFENLYEAYRKYRGRKLTEEEIQEIRKVKEENPPKVSAEWISEKMQELFPGVEWGGDLERIRRMLGRKKSE